MIYYNINSIMFLRINSYNLDVNWLIKLVFIFIKLYYHESVFT